MYIGVLSDTHGWFDPALERFFAPVDQLWHAGDIGGLEIADSIAAFKPLIAVHGNIDDQRVRRAHPKFQSFECEGVSVLMTHIANDPEAVRLIKQLKPTIFVSGHSHILKVFNREGTLHINPGAAGHGYQRIRTAVRFKIEGVDIHSLEVIEL